LLDLDVIKAQYDLTIDISSSSDGELEYQMARKLAEIALTRLP
jgi:hypothetical protein